MNYSKCPVCGGQVLNNQSFCTGCGNPVNNMNNANNFNNINNLNPVSNNFNNININPGMGKLILSRKESFYGFAVKLTVVINGYVYSLGNGFRYDLDLAPGVYNVTWKFWCRRDKTIQINVMPGNIYCVDFKPDYLWGGFKLSERCKFY